MDGYIYATYADGNRLQLNGSLFLRWKWRKVENHFFGIPWTLSQAVKVGMFPSQFCLLCLQMTTAMMDDNDNNEDVDNNNDDDLNHLTTDGRGSRHGGGSKVWTRSANKQLEVIARRQLTIQIQRWRKCSKINFLLDVNITKWLWFTNITKQYAYTQFKDVPWCVGWHIVNSGDIAICWHFSFTHSLIGNLKTCLQDHNHYNHNSTAPVCSLRKSGRSFSRN